MRALTPVVDVPSSQTQSDVMAFVGTMSSHVVLRNAAMARTTTVAQQAYHETNFETASAFDVVIREKNEVKKIEK